MKPPLRLVVLLILIALVMGVLGVKAVREGWFTVPPSLELDDQPALLFFTLSDGCYCQMIVVLSAEAQLIVWDLPADSGLKVIRLDFGRRPDLARQYGVARAPALVLLNAAGQVVWKQDVGLSDEAPLDLDQVEVQIEALIPNP